MGTLCGIGVTFLLLDRRKETMGNRPTGYWILVLIAIVAAVAAFMMRYSPDAHMRHGPVPGLGSNRAVTDWAVLFQTQTGHHASDAEGLSLRRFSIGGARR